MENDQLIEGEEEYESPQGSVWIVAVDDGGSVYILRRPNIHYSFFDCGDGAEEIGLPFEVSNSPGVYRWTCSVSHGKDEYSGEYWGPDFYVDKEELLWKLPD